MIDALMLAEVLLFIADQITQVSQSIWIVGLAMQLGQPGKQYENKAWTS